VFLAWRRQYCGIFKLEQDGVIYYFIDNEYYFKRPKLYGYYDDGERFGFFSKAVYQILPMLDFHPDVIHCNDWQTALIPIYIREDPAEYYRSIRTVFTIHNIEYQGCFGRETLEDLFGLPFHLYDNGYMAYENYINLMKGAIYVSDYITTVSPTYACELKDPYYAHGLHKVIIDNFHKMRGIINGIDISVHDPQTDINLYKNYSAKDPSAKVYNKLELQRLLGLTEDESVPMIACISRLVSHKGFDIVLRAIDRIMCEHVQFVVLGNGEWNYEQGFIAAENRYRGRLSAKIMYSGSLASKIYAGADMFLMPSKSEPCGLSQMIAMRYGAVPIVRETGGLKDTVFPYKSEYSNGFTFASYSPEDMLYVIREAIGLYYNKEEWNALMLRGMNQSFGWDKSAREYMEIYNQITSK